MRCLALALSLSIVAAPAWADDPVVTGVVVDPGGAPVPRAYVRAVEGSGRELARTFTDEAGRFRLAIAPGRSTLFDDCVVDAALTGFEPARAPCAAAGLRLVLAMASVRETVVVTATRTPAPSGQVGASVTTITAEDLESRRAPFVADLLRTTPGATVVRSGGLGTVTSLFVRGGESSHNKVLLDGIPLNEPGGVFNFSNLTTDNLERIEVVRGAHSALFGSDAMASVVQLFTKRAERSRDGVRGSASIEGGSYDTFRGRAAVSEVRGRFDYAIGVAQHSTSNRDENNAFDNTSLSANVGVRLDDRSSLRFIGRGELEHVGSPGQTAFGRPDLDAFFDRDDVTGGVAFDQDISPRLRHRASYALTSSNYRSTNLLLDPPYTPRYEGRMAPFAFSDFAYDLRTDLDRHHASYQADWRLAEGRSGDYRLTGLADWDGERAVLDDRLSQSLTEASRDNVGVSAQLQALWPRMFVTAGGRVEHNDSFGTEAVPRGSIVWVARAARAGAIGETLLRASAGLGVKEPTLLQSFSQSPFFLGNPALQPERSRTLEAAVEQRVADDRVKVELVWFDNRFENLISTRTTSFNPFRSQYFNVGLTAARGLELAGEAAPTRTLRARGGYTFVDSEVIESTSPGNAILRPGAWLFRRPRHSGFAGMSISLGRLAADVSGLFVGRFVDSDYSALVPAMVENPGYVTWDVRVSYRIGMQLTVTGAIDNLTDAAYMEGLGYPALGRAMRVGVRFDF